MKFIVILLAFAGAALAQQPSMEEQQCFVKCQKHIVGLTGPENGEKLNPFNSKNFQLQLKKDVCKKINNLLDCTKQGGCGDIIYISMFKTLKNFCGKEFKKNEECTNKVIKKNKKCVMTKCGKDASGIGAGGPMAGASMDKACKSMNCLVGCIEKDLKKDCGSPAVRELKKTLADFVSATFKNMKEMSKASPPGTVPEPTFGQECKDIVAAPKKAAAQEGKTSKGAGGVSAAAVLSLSLALALLLTH